MFFFQKEEIRYSVVLSFVNSFVEIFVKQGIQGIQGTRRASRLHALFQNILKITEKGIKDLAEVKSKDIVINTINIQLKELHNKG